MTFDNVFPAGTICDFDFHNVLSAGSIPVTRSNVMVQVGEVSERWAFGHLEAEGGRGPLALVFHEAWLLSGAP